MCLGAKLTPVDILSYGSPFKHINVPVCAPKLIKVPGSKHVNVPVCAPKLIKVPGSKHVKFYVTDTVDCLIKVWFIHSWWMKTEMYL